MPSKKVFVPAKKRLYAQREIICSQEKKILSFYSKPLFSRRLKCRKANRSHRSCLPSKTHKKKRKKKKKKRKEMLSSLSTKCINSCHAEYIKCHTHFKFSANNIIWSRLLIQIHILNGKQCRFRSVGFFQLIWIYTVCKGRVCPGLAGLGLISPHPHLFNEKFLSNRKQLENKIDKDV